MAEANNSIGAAQLANRRGFLLGITLAEILLIVLFVLLLLFRHSQSKAEVADVIKGVLGEGSVERLVAVGAQLPPITSSMVDEIADLTVELINCRELKVAECFPKDDLVQEGGFLVPLKEHAVAPSQPETLEEAVGQIEDLSEKLSSAYDALRTAQRKTGEKPFCTYFPPLRNSGKVRGRNVSVGTFSIEGDGITLIARDGDFLKNEFVDIVGETYDGSEAVKAILEWPLNVKLDFNSFAVRGSEFVMLGNREAKKRVTCRFGADFYYVPSEATDRAREKVLQEYFFLGGNRLSRKEFLSRVQAADE